MIGFPSPPALPLRDHSGTAPADPDASRPFAERDNGGPSRREPHDPCSSFGSDGRLGVDFGYGLPAHSLRCSKSGRDRSIGR
jgi:hypothetical protein